MEALVQAAYRQDKQALLSQANSRLQVARHLWRLCHELQAIDTRRYEHGARLLEGLGRQIGGWHKASAAARCAAQGGGDPRLGPTPRPDPPIG